MKCLVVSGGAGFIGSHTIRVSLERNLFDAIYVLDNLSTGSIANLPETAKIDIFVADVATGLGWVERLIKKCGSSYFLHLAAVADVATATRYPAKAVGTNVLGTVNFLELARKVDADRFVYASSAAVYGEPTQLPLNEESPTKPVNLYGLTKLIGELLTRHYGGTYGISWASLRYFNVYGPGVKSKPPTNVVHRFLEGVIRGETIKLYGDGNQTRDFIYIDDVVDANLVTLQSNVVGVYNVGTGRETSLNELLAEISRAVSLVTGRRPSFEIVYTRPRREDIRRSVADISKIREKLNWTPKTSLIDGLTKTAIWLLSLYTGSSESL